MDVSLIYEIPYPKPWYEGGEQEQFHEALEQIELADELGFHSAWATEHHFLTEFSHSSAPEVFLAAAAERTEDIRIGHGVAVLPYSHPVRVAERVATLDIISDGRVELGTGRSVTHEELGGFKLDPSDSAPMWQESIEVIPDLFQEGTHSFEGDYWEMGEREVWPNPVQDPHPPMFKAGTQPKSWEEVGEAGLGMLGLTLATDPEALGRRVDVYRDGLENADPVAKEINDKVSVLSVGICAETDERAKQISQDGVVNYIDQSFDFYTDWGEGLSEAELEEVPDSYQWYAEASQKVKERSETLKYDTLEEEKMIISGSPETIIEGIEEYEKQGIDEIMFLMQVGDIPHKDVMNSIELFGEKVIPYI